MARAATGVLVAAALLAQRLGETAAADKDDPPPPNLDDFADYVLCNKKYDSNLGGKGPDKWMDAEELRYYSVLPGVDLVVTAISKYKPKNPIINGLTGPADVDSCFGVINLKGGGKGTNSVKLKYKFVKTGTNTPKTMERFYFSWFDIDGSRWSEEIVTFHGAKQTYLFSDHDLEARRGAVDGDVIVEEHFGSGSILGTGADNPRDPRNLTDLQKSRAVTVLYEDMSEWTTDISVKGGRGGRNFAFAGFSGLVPTPSPTPSPSLSPTLSPELSPTPSPTDSATPSPTDSPKPSPTDSPSGPRTCHGYERMYDACPAMPDCEPCLGVDCAFGTWSDWAYQGGCSQLCYRRRGVAILNNECGNPCLGNVSETKVCSRAACDPAAKRDCVFGEWSSWSPCKDTTEQRQRLRQVILPPLDGETCEGSTIQTAPCGNRSTDAVDCKLSPWASWTPCDVTCGGGHQAQMRRILAYAKFGGRPCAAVLRRTQVCNDGPCEDASDCELSEWGDWKGCDKATSTQRYRSRELLRKYAGGGLRCKAPLRQTLACVSSAKEPAPCQLSAWMAWAECDATCGGGQTFRARSVVVPPRNGGGCDVGPLRETSPCNELPCPGSEDDCAFSDWSLWSDCSTTCGEGRTTRARTSTDAKLSGASGCNGALEESKGCRVEACTPVDCVWKPWQDWGGCSAECGGGTKRRTRAIGQMPRLGGKACDANVQEEVSHCNNKKCHPCVDGAWQDWSPFSVCSVSCGSGYRNRHRIVARQPSDCGKPVEGVEDEFVACHGPPCSADVDCVLGPWGAWSDCTSACFGFRERTREVLQYALGNGKPCGHEGLKVLEHCNPRNGEETPTECKEDRPDGCVWEPWEDWGPCSASCNGGQASRKRQIKTHAALEGEPCQGGADETIPCGNWTCSDEKCVDCTWAPWEDWQPCTSCGGQTYRRRSVADPPNYCGKPCDGAAAKEVSTCTGDCPAKRFCAWTDWDETADCLAEGGCGARSRLQHRTLELVDVEPVGGFLISSGIFAPVSVCSGAQVRHVPCPYVACHVKNAVDCVFGAWDEWSTPTWSQLCERKRKIQVASAEGGAPCAGPQLETKTCAKAAPAPENCDYSDWGEWSMCREKTDQSNRARTVTSEAKFGGVVCTGVVSETAACQPEPPASVSCVVEDWSEWGLCSASCGGGTRSKSRAIQTRAKHGGAGCTAPLETVEACGERPCGYSLDCELSAWEDWGNCEAKTASKSRKRKVAQEPVGGGKPCAGPLGQTIPCSTTEDCKVSPWTDWDGCDKTCGGGQHMRQRQVVRNPLDGGRACPGDLAETGGCNDFPCDDGMCKLSVWSDWGPCTATCGVGQQAKKRVVAVKGHGGCDGDLEVTRQCIINACLHIDCLWADWSQWSDCSNPCGGGQKRRSRFVQDFPRGLGKACDARDTTETAPCNTEECPYTCIDGRWGDWSAWSPCTATCAGGTKWRSRQAIRTPNSCGRPAEGLSQEVTACSESIPCVASRNCSFAAWGDWSGCTKPCQGVQRRQRPIFAYAHGDLGLPCTGDTKELRPCNPSAGQELPAACQQGRSQPIDCALGAWSAWSDCSEICGGGQRVRQRMVFQPPEFGGKDCDGTDLEETEGCNLQSCGTCVPHDCKWSDWGAWGACSKCGGQRQRYRSVLEMASCGGKQCGSKDAEQTEACDRECYTPTYCAWDDWTTWSKCSATCGSSGRRSRERGLTLSTEPPPRDDASADGQFHVRYQRHELDHNLQSLARKARDLETQRIQSLVASFGLGLGLFALAAAVLRTRQRDASGASRASFQRAPLQEPAAAGHEPPSDDGDALLSARSRSRRSSVRRVALV